MTQITEAFRSGMSLFTSRAVDILKAGKEGDSIDRDQMGKHIGRLCEPGDKGYANVLSAIRKVEREHGIVWRWDRTAMAWRCLNDTQKVSETSNGIAKSRRVAHRALRVASGVNTSKLTQDELKQHSRNVALAGIMEMAGRGDTQKKLADVSEVKLPDLKSFVKLLS